MAVQQYYPGFPPGTDPGLVKIIQHVYDRLNYLLGRIEAAVPATVVEERVRRTEVALQAVTDVITQGSTFVSFGQSQPVADTTSVSLTASGVGFSISGPSSGATISVTNAATARAAINAAQKESPAVLTATLAKITPAGADGSITFSADGVLTALVAPT